LRAANYWPLHRLFSRGEFALGEVEVLYHALAVFAREILAFQQLFAKDLTLFVQTHVIGADGLFIDWVPPIGVVLDEQDVVWHLHTRRLGGEQVRQVIILGQSVDAGELTQRFRARRPSFVGFEQR